MNQEAKDISMAIEVTAEFSALRDLVVNVVCPMARVSDIDGDIPAAWILKKQIEYLHMQMAVLESKTREAESSVARKRITVATAEIIDAEIERLKSGLAVIKGTKATVAKLRVRIPRNSTRKAK